MLLVSKNNLGSIFVSNNVISKILSFNLSKNKFNIKFSDFLVNNNSVSTIEVIITPPTKNDFNFVEMNDFIYSKIKDLLLNNFNYSPKNILIIYKNT